MAAGAQVDPEAPGAGDQGEQDSWAQAASAPTGTTPQTGTSPAAQQVQQAAAGAGAPDPAAPQADMSGDAKPPEMPAPTAPVVTSQKPGGIAGLMHSLLGALVGKTTPEYGTDQYGNQYVKQATATGGEQWRRLAGEAIAGAAEGLKAGRGAGNMGAAAAAGLEAGQKLAQGRQQQEQQMTAEARAQNLENANAQMQRMNLAEQSLRLTRMQQEVDAPTIQASKDLATTYAANGEMVGHVNNLKEGAAFLKENPDHFAQLIQQQRVGYVPTYTTDPKTGKAVATGMDIYLMKDGWRKDVMPPGSAFQHYNDATGQVETYHTSSPMSAGEITDMTTAAIAQSKKAQADAAEAKQKAADEADKLANTATERGLKKAQTTEAYARANEAIATANKLKTPAPDDPTIKNLGEAVAHGTLSEDQISKFGKGTLGAIQSYLATNHPNLDQKSVFLDANERKQVNLASNALENLEKIHERLQARPDLVGMIQGRLTEGKFGAGTNDKDLGYIEEAIDNFGLATTGTHGTRAQMAREDAKRALINGFKNGPQALEGAYEAAENSLSNLASAGKPRTVDGKAYVPGQAPTTSATQPPPAPATPAAAGMKQIWAPGSPTWKEVPAAQVPQNVPGLVVR